MTPAHQHAEGEKSTFSNDHGGRAVEDERFPYDAFLSYGREDEEMAGLLRRGLERVGRRPLGGRVVKVWRDRESLGAHASLERALHQGIDRSRSFVLLASPNAAKSDWVNKEVDYWLATRPDRPPLIVLAAGDIAWGPDGLDHQATTALPPALGKLEEEPAWVDLRRLLKNARVDDPGFEEGMAGVAAPIRGLSKDQVVGDHIRQRRTATRLVAGTATMLAILLVLSIFQTVQASTQRSEAQRQRTEAQNQARVATARLLVSQAQNAQARDPKLAIRLALAANALDPESAGSRTLQDLLSNTSLIGLIPHVQSGDGDSMRFNPTSNSIALIPNGEGVEVWDPRPLGASTRQAMLDNLQVGPYPSLNWSADGKFIALNAYARGVVAFYEADRLDCGCPHEVHLGEGVRPIDIALAASGTTLAVLTDTGLVEVWDITDLTTPRSRSSLRFVDPSVINLPNRVAISDDGRYAAASSPAGIVSFLDANRQDSPLLANKDIGYGGGGPLSIAFLPNAPKPTLISGSREGKLDEWEIDESTVEIAAQHPGHTNVVTSVAASPDGRLMATGGYDGTVRLWARGVTTELHQILQIGDTILGLSISADSSLIAVRTSEGTELHAVPPARTGTQPPDPDSSRNPGSLPSPSPLTGHGNTVRRIAARPGDPSVFASAGVNDVALLWKHRGEPTGPASTRLVSTGRFTAEIAWNADGSLLAASDEKGGVQIFDVGTDGAPHEQVYLHGPHLSRLDQLQFDEQNRLIAIGDGAVSVWNLQAPPEPAWTWRSAEQGAATSLSADGQVISTAENILRLWTIEQTGLVEEAELLVPLTPPKYDHYSTGLSADGRAVFAHNGRELVVWRASGRQWSALPVVRDNSPYGFSAGVLEGSALGNLLAVGNSEGFVRIFQIEDGRAQDLAAIPTGSPQISAISITSDSRALIVGGSDGGIRTLPLDGLLRVDLVQTACSIVRTGLSQVEWDSYTGGMELTAACP